MLRYSQDVEIKRLRAKQLALEISLLSHPDNKGLLDRYEKVNKDLKQEIETREEGFSLHARWL